jgi:REase_AHJR-like
MTATQTVKKTNERLLKLANKYRNQGYEVTSHPNTEDLPDFLREYSPELIAHRGDGSIVVEVKSHSSLSSLPSEYLSGLAKVIEQHQGWRLDFVMDNSEDIFPYPSQSEGSLQQQDIEARLSIAKQIISQNLDSAVLYAWALVEATLRLLAEKDELSLKRSDPLYLVTYLTHQGVISQSEYRLLRNALSLRNTIAHGFKTSQLTANSVDELIEVTEKLLIELSEPLEVG